MRLRAVDDPPAAQDPGSLRRLLQRAQEGVLNLASFSVAHALAWLLKRPEKLDLEGLADTIATGARLLLLKSRGLLPLPLTAPSQDERREEEPEHHWEDLRLFKGATDFFRHQEAAEARTYPRLTSYPDLKVKMPLPEITLAELALALEEAQRRRPPDPLPLSSNGAVSLSEKMVELEAQLTQGRRVSFRRVLAGCLSRQEQVVCFLALLQLLRRARVRVLQDHLFSDILILPASA